jgi:hypothetical protein
VTPVDGLLDRAAFRDEGTPSGAAGSLDCLSRRPPGLANCGRSWLNRIEAQFTALRYFTLDGTDHATHDEQASMIRRYIAWRNRNTDNPRLRRIVERANVA